MRLALVVSNPANPAEEEREDAVLVESFLGGDGRAFDELVRRHQRKIFHLARRYVKNDADAKDITQRAFVRAFQGLAKLRGSGAFKTWIYKIAVNLALNHVRDHSKVKPTEDAGVDVPVDPIGDGRLEGAERQEKLSAAVAELPPKQRLVLELRVYEELSFKDVAEAAGCTENAAKVNFHHAVKRLREKIG